MEFEAVSNAFKDALLSVLPLSPFTQFIDQFRSLPYLGYLNWFFPIGAAIRITATWITVIGTYYTWMVLLRWLKVIGD